jgi:hypothetical protein
LRDPLQHGVVGGSPGVFVPDLCGFLAADTQGAMLILVKNVPNP